MIQAVIFDLDGVLIDSEHLWDRVRREVAAEAGRPWPDGATAAMQGMSSTEWPRYMRRSVGLGADERELMTTVVERMKEHYAKGLPLLPGAVDAVRQLGGHWPLALASSSNRELIDAVLESAGLTESFKVTVSSEEVERGKPAPDVYLAAATALSVDPRACCAVEDSANGIRSALAASMSVIAVPNQHYPPPPDVIELCSAVLDGLGQLTPIVVRTVSLDRMLDEEETESFPASDPHSDWAGA